MCNVSRQFLRLPAVQLCKNQKPNPWCQARPGCGGFGSAWGRDGVIALERTGFSQCPVPGSSPASSALPASSSCTGAAWQGFFFFSTFFYLFPFFFWNPVQQEHSRDPRGFAAVQRRCLVLCQILCWGRAGGNPFCNVSAGAVGKSPAKCSSH